MGIKSVVWGHVVNDLPKIRSHLKFYLYFGTLHKNVIKYLNSIKKKVQSRNRIVGAVKGVINAIHLEASKLSKMMDQTLVPWILILAQTSMQVGTSPMRGN